MFLRLMPRPIGWILEALAVPPISVAPFSPLRLPARLGGSGGMFGMSNEKAVLAAVADAVMAPVVFAGAAPKGNSPLPLRPWLRLSRLAIVCCVCVIVFACS